MSAKICIAIVTNRLIKPKTVFSLINLKVPFDKQVVVATEGYTTAEGRTYCVVQAIKNNCTHILFIDDDMTFPPETLEKLLSHGKAIVGVASHSRKLPLTSTVSMYDEEMPKELFKCHAVGMGVALIDLKIFSEIERPWFKFETHENGRILIGEDAWLCQQARNKGYEVYCDPTIEIKHLGDYEY